MAPIVVRFDGGILNMMCKQSKHKINISCIIFAMFCLLNIFLCSLPAKKPPHGRHQILIKSCKPAWLQASRVVTSAARGRLSNVQATKNPARGGVAAIKERIIGVWRRKHLVLWPHYRCSCQPFHQRYCLRRILQLLFGHLCQQNSFQ